MSVYCILRFHLQPILFAKGRGLSLVYDASATLKPRRFVVLIVAHQRGVAPLRVPSPCPVQPSQPHKERKWALQINARFPAKLQSLLTVCGQPIFLSARQK